jgi:hypothetical protein
MFPPRGHLTISWQFSASQLRMDFPIGISFLETIHVANILQSQDMPRTGYYLTPISIIMTLINWNQVLKMFKIHRNGQMQNEFWYTQSIVQYYGLITDRDPHSTPQCRSAEAEVPSPHAGITWNMDSGDLSMILGMNGKPWWDSWWRG